jgi:hypothetical protein
LIKKAALLVLLSLSCGSTRRSVIVVSLSYDATVKNPETITNLQVTVDGLTKKYPVPPSAPFQRCTATTPCSLEIDTQRTGRLEIRIAGMEAVTDGGAYLVLGIGSGSAMADVNMVQTVAIQLSCVSGGCGLVVGNDGGATDGGVGGSSSATGGNGGRGGSIEGKAGAGGVVGGAGAPGRGGATGSGGANTGGIAATGGTAGAPVAGSGGIASTGGTAGAPVVGGGGMVGTGGTAGAAANGMPGTGGRGGMSGAAGQGGRGIVTGSGGMAGGGGKGGVVGGSGGAAGKGGAPGTGGAGGAVGANCADSIKMNGYSWPGVPACSACLDNGISQEAKCASIISCVDQNYPCAGDCLTNCHNQSGGNLVVFACANALLTAACN